MKGNLSNYSKTNIVPGGPLCILFPSSEGSAKARVDPIKEVRRKNTKKNIRNLLKFLILFIPLSPFMAERLFRERVEESI